MVTCHGHSPGGHSSPLTIRVIDDISQFEASRAVLWLVPLLNSSSVELVELLLSDFVPLVLVFCRYRKIVLTFSVIIPPHLKVSARVYIRFEGFSFIFLLGQSRCLSLFPHRWIGRIYRPVPVRIRRHKSIERYPGPLGKSVHIHRFHSRRAVEQLQIHRRQQRLFRVVTLLAAIKTD